MALIPARRRLQLALAGLAIVLAVVAVVMMRSTPGPATGQSGAPTLTFMPAEAPPAAPVHLSGVEVLPGMEFEVRIGGHAVAAQRMEDGRIQTHVPVVMDEDGWPLARKGEQAIEVHGLGRLLARSEGGIRILELPRAPGTAAKVQGSLQTIVDGYERIFEALPADDEREMAHRRAVMAMLHGLVDEGAHSLAALVAGESAWLEGAAQDLALTDALLASSGVAGHYAARAATFERGGRTGGAALPVSLALPMPMTGPRCRASGAVFDLACKLQAHAVLTDFSQTYVKPTADAYADIVGVAIGAIGLPPAGAEALDKNARLGIPLHQITSALLSVVAFTMDKVAPSLLPSAIDRFELEMPRTLIGHGDMTASRLMVQARNQPQTITASDMVELFKSILGLPGLDKRVENQITKVGFFVIDLYAAALRRFGVTPPSGMNPEVFTMPLMRWGPLEVDHPDLVQLFSLDASVLQPREDVLEWRGVGSGTATVRVVPRGGDRGKVLVDNTLCWGCAWHGTAFGMEVPSSTKEVSVDVGFKALKPRGRAPHTTPLRWTLKRSEDGQPIPCTIDFGDGSRPERLPDCTAVQQVRHEFSHTSRLNEGGAWTPTLRIDGTGIEASTEVFADWSFRGHPDAGEVPVEASFSWKVPWPPDRTPPACEFDPGDGSERQRFPDCLATTRATHTFERRGSFVPTLTLIHGGMRDSLSAPVSVSEPFECDEDLLRHKAWRGRVTYSRGREVWDARKRDKIVHSASYVLGGDMAEVTRREFRGREDVVQYRTTTPDGSPRKFLQKDSFDHEGNWKSTYKFEALGIRHVPDDAKTGRDTGSMLSLTLRLSTCSFEFDSQIWANGTASFHTEDESWTVPAFDVVGAASGRGHLSAAEAFSGYAPVRMYGSHLIASPEERSPLGGPAVIEDKSVFQALDGKHLGEVMVHWEFSPIE